MAKELPTIPFTDFARHLPAIFDQIARHRTAVLVERDGVLYRLERQPAAVHTAAAATIWANYDPAKVRAALHRAAGAFAGLDREAFLKEIKQQRAQDSAGRPAE